MVVPSSAISHLQLWIFDPFESTRFVFSTTSIQHFDSSEPRIMCVASNTSQLTHTTTSSTFSIFCALRSLVHNNVVVLLYLCEQYQYIHYYSKKEIYSIGSSLLATKQQQQDCYYYFLYSITAGEEKFVCRRLFHNHQNKNITRSILSFFFPNNNKTIS